MNSPNPLRNSLQESNTQFHKAWSLDARVNPKGEVVGTNGVLIATADVTWSWFNVALLLEPVSEATDFDARVRFASEYYKRKERAWIFCVCEDWVAPPLRPRVAEILKRPQCAMWRM